MFKPAAKIILAVLLVAAGQSLFAVAPPKGADRLRELAVFPTINLGFTMGLGTDGNDYVIYEKSDQAEIIGDRRQALKSKPDDVHALLRLSNVLDDAGQTNESAVYFKKAELLCREKLLGTPQSGPTMTDLARALAGQEKNEEAETFFRRASQVSSNDWRCWVGYGNFLDAQAMRAVLAGHMYDQAAGAKPMAGMADADHPPSAEAIALAEKRLGEAAHCFSVARTIAPNDPDLYLQSAGQALSSTLSLKVIRQFKNGEKPEESSFYKSLTSEPVITNLLRAAQLDPKNSQYPAFVAYLKYMQDIYQPGARGNAPGQVSDEARQSMIEMKKRLEKIADDPEKSNAASALDHLGFVDLFMGNFSEAKTCAERALALDPKRDNTYELLLSASAQAGADTGEIVKICQARLNNKNSVRNHLILARAYQHQKDWEEVREQTGQALKLEPNNPGAHLQLAALDLKQSADLEYLKQAETELKNVSAILLKAQPGQFADVGHDYFLNTAIYIDLSDAPRKKEAATAILGKILNDNPDDEQAKTILSALE